MAKHVRRDELKGIRDEIRSELTQTTKQTQKTFWLGAITNVVIAFVGAGGLIGASAITASEPDTIVCSETYERVLELYEDGSPPIFPAESAEQKQCNVNGYLELLP